MRRWTPIDPVLEPVMTSFLRRRVRGHGLDLELIDTGGDGPPVLFLHGVMGRGVNWQATLRALAPRYRCIALDQRGHGRSDQPEGPYDRDAYVADIACVIDALEFESVALVGHSTGALNAWVYAARHPTRVDALVLEDMCAGMKGGDFLPGWRRWFDSWPLPFAAHADVVAYFSTMRESLGPYFAEVFAEGPDGWRPMFRPETILATLAGNEVRDWWAELAAVQAPSLVVRGAHSDWLAPDEAQRMVQTLRHGRLAVVADAHHTVHVDQPQAYARLVNDFLDETSFTKFRSLPDQVRGRL
jgi:pimeloyl-ACP methyl ester carboxylesterase